MLQAIKISELGQLTGQGISDISRYFKSHSNDLVIRKNNRIIGITPEAVDEYLASLNINIFSKPSVLLSANLCGGVGKTTSIYTLGSALRRLTHRKIPLLYIDGDPQGSLTSLVFGTPAEDSESILIDFLEGKAKVDDILTNIDNNVWFIKSNLNQAWIDRVLHKPNDLRNGMLNLYTTLFEKFGRNLHIFQDHSPQLSNLFASSLCALYQLQTAIVRGVIIPIRSDKFAIKGADHILKEIEDMKKGFAFNSLIDIHCFFSNIDHRLSTTTDAIKLAHQKEKIIETLSPVSIRYSSEIPKSIMRSTNIYEAKRNRASEDYQSLLKHIFKD